LPAPQAQPEQPPLLREEEGAGLLPAVAEANTESFLESFAEPQWGHRAPFQLLERTRISLSRSHFSHTNS